MSYIKLDLPRKADKKKHPPLRTFRELCSDLNVPEKLMSRIIAGDPNHPKKIFRHSGMTGSNTWYEPVEFKKWFHSKMGEKK